MGKEQKRKAKLLKIAVLGHKTIPSRQGGIEIVVEELTVRMAKLGHKITVYNRSGHHVSGKEFDSKKIKRIQRRSSEIRAEHRCKRAGSDDFLLFCRSGGCIWKIRCCAFSCRRTLCNAVAS